MKSPSEIAREISIKNNLAVGSKIIQGVEDDVIKAITTERQRQERLVEALKEFGTHHSECNSLLRVSGELLPTSVISEILACNCGLLQVLKEVNGA